MRADIMKYVIHFAKNEQKSWESKSVHCVMRSIKMCNFYEVFLRNPQWRKNILQSSCKECCFSSTEYELSYAVKDNNIQAQ